MQIDHPLPAKRLEIALINKKVNGGARGVNGGVRGVMVIVVGNGHGDTSSNPRRG